MTISNTLARTRPPHYPPADLMRFAAKQTNPFSLGRAPVPVHPAHFVVGMDEKKHPLYPEGLPGNKVEGTAISCASYLARVDQVTDRGEVSVTLWERPNGREGLTTLLVDGPLEGKRPSAGDLLWIWTWNDVVQKNHTSQQIPKIHIEIETRELTESDRRQLKQLLHELREQRE